jgi:hypothetical protein
MARRLVPCRKKRFLQNFLKVLFVISPAACYTVPCGISGGGFVAKPITRSNFMKKHYLIVLALAIGLVFAGCDDPEEGKNPPKSPISYFVGSGGNDSANNGLTEKYPFQTLAKAYSEAVQDTDHKTTIVVLSNLESGDAVSLSPPVDITATEPVVIKGNVAGLTITRNELANDSVLEIAGGAKIRFENIKVNGKADPSVYHRAIIISGAQTEVTLGNGAVITGQRSTATAGSDGGAGVLVSGGAKLVMGEGSEVTGCIGATSGDAGAGVYVNGSGSFFTMNDGASITGNNAYDDGGGVYIYNSGEAEMYGGTIHGNTLSLLSNGWGGGVCIAGSNSKFTMKGGVISGNKAGPTATAGKGGGVHLNSGTFAMNGGVIYGNESNVAADLKNTAGQGDGAAFYKTSSGTAKKNGDPLDTSETTITAP